MSGSVQFWEPVLVADQRAFLGELQRAAHARVVQAVEQQTGLTPSPADLERIEWLVIWQAEADTLDRLAAFQGGWSAALPPGTRARDLDAAGISQLARRIGLPAHPRLASTQQDEV